MTAVLPFSVLMTTYSRERADYLRLSLTSLMRQTLPAAEIVLVLDGPVGIDQELVIADFLNVLPLKVVRLQRNLGLAGALAEGLKTCTQPWCARMDSDDICDVTRFERQWQAIQSDPDLDLVATWTAEFEDDPTLIQLYKTGPMDHAAIVRTLYWRNVVHHPTVVMRKDAVIKAGGYSTRYPLLEDYDLFLRLVSIGAKLSILPQALLLFRTNVAQRRRRGGFKYLHVEARFRYRCATAGLTPAWIALLAFVAAIPFRLAPVWVKSVAYKMVREKTLQRNC